jgi:hypothetical protein
MWDELRTYSAQFRSAVLTGLDAAGYPYSVRCRPTLDEASQIVRIAPVPGALLEPGRAGLLYHQHDEQLWSLKSFLLRGRLELGAQEWFFHPEQLIYGGGLRHPLRDATVLFQMRRAAKAYLNKRGLTRPRIPWEEIKALYPRKDGKK